VACSKDVLSLQTGCTNHYLLHMPLSLPCPPLSCTGKSKYAIEFTLSSWLQLESGYCQLMNWVAEKLFLCSSQKLGDFGVQLSFPSSICMRRRYAHDVWNGKNVAGLSVMDFFFFLILCCFFFIVRKEISLFLWNEFSWFCDCSSWRAFQPW